MKKITVPLVSFFLIMLLCMPSFVCAEDVEVPKPHLFAVAIVDIQRILKESLAAQHVQKQIEIKRSFFQKDIAKEEVSLREAEKELTQIRSKEKPAVYAEKEQNLRRRFISVERRVQSRRKALDKAYTESMDAVRQKLLNVVEVGARKRGVSLVVVKQQALWSDNTMDMTDEVLEKLNKELPNVDVVIEENSSDLTENNQ